MKASRKVWTMLFAVVALLACGPASIPFSSSQQAPTLVPGNDFVLSPIAPSSVPASASPLPAPLPTAFPTATEFPTATPDTPWLTGEVRVYPGPLHYSGDILSVEAAVENIQGLKAEDAQLEVNDSKSQVKAFSWVSPLRDNVLVFRWVWDTSGLTGLQALTIKLPQQPGFEHQELTAKVDLLPAANRPAQEQTARWVLRNTACCQIYYVTNTAAARDIATIDEKANEAVALVERKTGFPISNKPIPLVMIDNVWGNGAYTSSNVVISYVDRSYVATDLDSVLRHEITHWAMSPLGEHTPTIFVEGVAVYITGGHYQPEPLPQRGAALLESGLYIPLTELADHFRESQHEIAYAEAGSLVYYLVETYGWARLVNVYGNKEYKGAGSEYLNEAFQDQYHKNLSEVETDFKTWLGTFDGGEQVENLRLTIKLLDTVRTYQDLYAPYQEALPPVADAMSEHAVSEFMREPTDSRNIALETMLYAAVQYLRTGQYSSCEAMLDAVQAALYATGPFPAPAIDYQDVAQAVADKGYEAQRIDLQQDTATVWAIHRWPTLEVLKLTRVGGAWEIAAN